MALAVVTAVSCLIAAGGVGFVSCQLSRVHQVDVAVVPDALGETENFQLAGSDTGAIVSPDDPNAKAFLSGPTSTGPCEWPMSQ